MYITVELFIEKKKKKGLYYCIILARLSYYYFKIINAKFDIHVLSI